MSPIRGRLSSRAFARFHPLVFAIFAAFALAAAVSPVSAIAHTAVVVARVRLAILYWCSMLFGASPFLAAGAIAAACARIVSCKRSVALIAIAIFLPGCDCTINSLAYELRRLPKSVAAFAVTWGACCNPLALAATYFVLGTHVAAWRGLCGLVAAVSTACVWGTHKFPIDQHACQQNEHFADTFLDSFGRGLSSFAIAAAVVAAMLAATSLRLATKSSIIAAALGALLSPCSTSDSLLARALFTTPKCQFAFVVAAQCLDIRQALMLARTFGTSRMLAALALSAVACGLGCAFI